MTKRLVVVGQGYVGLPLSVRAVEAGYDVIGFDIDTDRVEAINAGTSPVEDIPDTRLQAAVATDRFRATSHEGDLAEFEIAVVSVPTPLTEGNPDLSFIESAARVIGGHLRAGATVILESTTYPGTTQDLVAPILEERSGLTVGADFNLGYSPERIDPGNPSWTLENTPKIVSGVDPTSLEVIQRFFDQLVERTVPVSSPREAELAKLLENTFRHVNIALVNELAVFAADLGIDVWEAIDAASTKPFGFMRFTPGPGVGGHCLPIDPSYLSWQVKASLGETFRFVELANDVNAAMPTHVVRQLMVLLNEQGLPLRGQRIVLLGLAYKRNTADARESPAHPIARRLLDLHAEVLIADPHVLDVNTPEGATRVDPDPEVLATCAAAVVLVDHDAFDLGSLASQVPLVFDTRRSVPPAPNVTYL